MMMMMMMLPMKPLVVLLLEFCKGTPSLDAEFHLGWIVVHQKSVILCRKLADSFLYFAILHISP